MKPASLQRIRIASVVGDRLLASPWMRRLSRISFLGTLDGHPRSRHRSTRWDHSLCVAERGVEVARDLELDEERTGVFVAACLLHDIGHYPLSHAAEPAFARVFGQGHHGVSEWIVRGTGPVAVDDSLRPILEDERIDADVVWSVIAGETEDPILAQLAALLVAPINLDTLDGIPRVVHDFRLRRRHEWAPRPFHLEDGRLHLSATAIETMDAFWLTKDHVYSTVINLPSNILAEARLCDLVAAHVQPEAIDHLARLDDAWLEERLGSAMQAARPAHAEDETYQLATHTEHDPGLVRIRKRYFVDERTRPGPTGLPLSHWRERYRHERAPAYLVSKGRQLELPGLWTLESPEI